jgi:hypothetical protein
MATDGKENDLDFSEFILSDDPIGITEDPSKEEEKKENETTEATTEETETKEEESEDTEGAEDTEDGGDDEESEEVDEQEEEEEEESTEEESSEEEEELGNGFTSIIELMHEQNGWEYNAEDFKDSDSIEGLNDFIKEVIEANSQPEYASEETQRFDEFVRKYGPERAAEFLETNFGQVDYSNLDKDNEEHLKTAMRDYLKKTTKFSDKKIEKQIEKAEELGELEEEFDENIEFLIEAQKKEAEELEKAQEEEKVARQQEFQNYLNTQKDRIFKSDEIAGFELSDKDKDGLYKFAYEPGRDGRTGYQKLKEQDKDLDLKLLMLAYKGVDKAKISKDAETKAVKKLKKELSRHTDRTTGSTKGASAPKKTKSNESTDYSAFVFKK